MDIYPQDLGENWQIALLRRRTSSQMQTPEPGGARRRIGWLGRQWVRGTGLSPEASAATLDAMRPTATGFLCGFGGGSTGFWMPGIGLGFSGEPAIGAILACLGAVMVGTGLALPGVWLRRLARQPVGESEIEILIAGVRDDLERTYLTLALEAVHQPVDPRSEDGVRRALGALGETINRLPAASPARPDANSLRSEAARTRDDALREADPVVAASCRRRANALDRAAESASRSEHLLRRAAALRDELTAQAEALRLGLMDFGTGTGDLAGLAELADTVQAVATEAASVSAARAELDAALAETPCPPAPVTTEPEVQTVGLC